jgi:hypothetical protein
VLLRLLNKLSLPPNRPPRLLSALLRLLEDLRLVAVRLLLSKLKRRLSVLPQLLVRLAKLLNRRLRLNACKCNYNATYNTQL